MRLYKATQFNADTCEQTGAVEYYMADSAMEATYNCLYTHGLKSGKSFVGPTGRVVYSLGMGYAITLDTSIAS